MYAHFFGKAYPNPYKPTSTAIENSIAILRFMDAVRGEVVHKPANPFRAVSVRAERRYCLGCCGVRVHDVVCDAYGVGRVAMCRGCGGEGAG